MLALGVIIVIISYLPPSNRALGEKESEK